MNNKLIDNIILLAFKDNYNLEINKVFNNPYIDKWYYENNKFYKEFQIDQTLREFILFKDYYFMNQDKDIVYCSNKNYEIFYKKGFFNFFKLESNKGIHYYILSILYYDKKYTDDYNKGENYKDQFLNVSKKLGKIKYPKVILFFFKNMVNIELFEFLINFYKKYLKNKTVEKNLWKNLLSINTYNTKLVINDSIKIILDFNFYQINYEKKFNDNKIIFMIIFHLWIENNVWIFYNNILEFIHLCNIIFYILQPFQFINLFIPNLNLSNIHRLEDVVPYFIGIDSNYKSLVKINKKGKFILQIINYEIKIIYQEELFINKYELEINNKNSFELKIIFYNIWFDFIKNIIFYFKNKEEINLEYFNIRDCFDIENFIKNNKDYFLDKENQDYFVNLSNSVLFYNLIENLFIYLSIKYFKKKYKFNEYLFEYLDIFIKGYFKCYLLVKNKSENYIFEYNFDDIFYFSNLIKYFKKELNLINYEIIKINLNIIKDNYDKLSDVSSISEHVMINKKPLYIRLNEIFETNIDFESNNFKLKNQFNSSSTILESNENKINEKSEINNTKEDFEEEEIDIDINEF